MATDVVPSKIAMFSFELLDPWSRPNPSQPIPAATEKPNPDLKGLRVVIGVGRYCGTPWLDACP